ncbi:MAG: carboxylate-amine ligase [Chloroflexi bacterium AL-N10]|nr:carboxylate-amine ligase [Chloroflexi bacterium AL-N10]NOK92766.1 carboxylate-amine ligase [Chloroflexi bacterium AL-N15]
MNNAVKEQFKILQNKLRDRPSGWDIIDQDDYDIFVVPSFSIDQKVGGKVPGFLHYEERLLFSLMRLRNPHTRLIYITALPLSPLIRDYYLQLLSGIPFSHASDRLLLISTYDASLKPLTQKILERPRLVEKIKRALRPNKSYMVCFNATYLEQELSVKLGIPLLASSPDLLYWGSKSGSREIFAECNIPHPSGSNQINSVDELIIAAAELWEKKPTLKRMVVKLNEGFSGEGNAILNLPKINDNNRQLVIENNLKNLSFQAQDETWENFSQRIPELGAIVEEFIEGEEKFSPSVQGYINPTGKVEILSTHDQILGGADGQIYLGCTFPADAEYRLQLQELGLKVGHALAKKGAMERYGVDFIAVRKKDKSWDIQAIEINLRKGGTTHPFMTLRLLTNGEYNHKNGNFYTPQGHAKYYIATDNLQKPQYRGLLPDDLMDIIAKHRLHFDSSTKTGTVFHLMGALSEFGKLGLTSIGNSLEEAKAIYQKIEQVLDSETESNIYQNSEILTSSLPITWWHES